MSVTEIAPRGGDFERTPPHDIDAERCVLGGMLLSKDAISDVLEVTAPQDHYRPAHQIVHEVILEAYPKALRQRCLIHRSRKESTCRCCCLAGRRGDLWLWRVAGWRRPGKAVFVLEQGQGFADGVADGGSADIAEGVGENIQRAQSSLVEKLSLPF